MVYVLSAVDGCIPSDMAISTTAQIEEERRLLYVAITPAKDHLTVVVPLRFYTQGTASDRHVYASRTRFISEELTSKFEVTSWPLVQGDVARAREIIDLAAPHAHRVELGSTTWFISGVTAQ